MKSTLTTFTVLVALVLAPNALAALPDYPDDEVAGLPVNYTEAKVGEYQLPDPLAMEDGTPVTTPAEWREKRRPELRALFAENQYGNAPGKPANMRFEVLEEPTSAFDGAARREQVRIHFGEGDKAQYLDLLIYVPAEAQGAVPLLLSINFMPNNLAVDDPAVQVGRIWNREKLEREPAKGPSRFGHLPVEQIVSAGFGIATFNYADVDPDAKEGFAHGVRQQYPNPESNDWGTIAAWAWGISRIVDYFETDDLVDAKRIAITGISRLGKTVMWAGANDERIAAVIASCSGEGGAALSRRNYGETIGHLASPQRYAYQFAENYQKWAPDPHQAPVDAHELAALIAPRPLLLQTGTSDKWSDPLGEFLAAKAATPVYELLGESGIASDTSPEPNTLTGGTLSFYMHEGGHGMMPGDWEVFLDFLKQHLTQ